MSEEFKKLVINTVQVEKIDNKEEVIGLLKLSAFEFHETGEWSGYHAMGKHKEFIYMRIVPEKMEKLRAYEDVLNRVCNDVYRDNDYFTFEGVVIKPGSFKNADEDSKQEILFEDIEKRIIEEIRNARYMIWIAMAWFTSEKIYRELIKKKREGLNIVIILDKNDINEKASFDLSKSFETYSMVVPTVKGNTMHNKFCIIDLRIVLHGTFNWTNRASFNEETFNVDSDNRELAEQFADKFLELKREAVKQQFASDF